jgi:myb proto-oncogene protein
MSCTSEINTWSEPVFAVKRARTQKKWTKEEDELLINLAENYRGKNWKEISKCFSKKSSLQCFSRFKRIRPGIVKGSWRKEEDDKICELVNKYGKTWSKIAKMLGTRNGKQIRDRYINVLDTGIKKGKFTEEEDILLINLYNQYGSKWATIAKFFKDRTADMIKNRFHSSIKKKLFPELCLKRENSESKVNIIFPFLFIFS